MLKVPKENIRNYAIIGASGAGKTSLAETMLFNAGSINRHGTVDDGTTTMDYINEEIEKKMSLRLSVANLKWKSIKHNLIDSPGYSDFKGDLINSLRGVETALVTIEAVNGYEVMTDFALQYASNLGNTKAIIINKMDRENAKFDEIVTKVGTLHEELIVPLLIPIGLGHDFKGVVNAITKKAFIDGAPADIPADLVDKVDEHHEHIVEAAAESDDALMEKYFEEGSLTPEEIISGLKSIFVKGRAIPILCCSATKNNGVKETMNLINDFFPSPQDSHFLKVRGVDKEEEINLDEYDKKLGYIIKSVSEQNQGDISIIRMYSDSLKPGDEFEISESQTKNKVGQVFNICGKVRQETDMISEGDIGVMVKVKGTQTALSIGEKGATFVVKPYDYPESVFWKTIHAASQSDEDKIGTALSKIMHEDPSIVSTRDSETKQNILSGQGELQINLIIKTLENVYNIHADLTTPKIPYKETITGKAQVRYRHKKQSGGHGQYGEVYIRIAPKPIGEGFEFINSIVGGAIPSKFIPAVEKGLVETLQDGIIAGYPIVDISVELYDGTFHDVDSSEMAFKIAARNALKDGFVKANPIILEPIHEVKIVVPMENMGDVMGIISSVRGKILGMSQEGNKQIINTELPLSELYEFYTTLKSLTQGKGYFSQKFGYYQKLQSDLAQKVIAAHQKEE
ncbi:MAG: elongation factor G [Candidatus Cloacimonadota bacterium]|nr:elongation factor G [Candidatus Cloacimonadota bacterium]